MQKRGVRSLGGLGLAVVLTAVLALAAGCSATPQAASSPTAAAAGPTAASAPKPTSGPGAGQPAGQRLALQLAYSAISQAYWPMWIAKEIGAFDKYGIDASLVFVEGNRSVNGVIAGTTPVSFIAGTDIMAPSGQGADLVALMTSGGEQPANQIWGAKGITNADALRGKTAGTNELGGEADKLLRYGLQQMGLTPDKDVRVVAVGEQSVRVAALQAGRVDSALMDPGFEKQLEDQGFAILYDFRKSSLLLQKGTLVTTRSYLEKNRGTVLNVVKALLEGFAYEKANKAGTVAIAQKYSANVSADVISGLWDRFAPALPDNPAVQPAAIEGLKLFYEDPKIKALDVSKMVDGSLVQEARGAR